MGERMSEAEKELAMKRDENKNVEYKESWCDKCPEWICGGTIGFFYRRR